MYARRGWPDAAPGRLVRRASNAGPSSRRWEMVRPGSEALEAAAARLGAALAATPLADSARAELLASR
jgi:hypothetical protein